MIFSFYSPSPTITKGAQKKGWERESSSYGNIATSLAHNNFSFMPLLSLKSVLGEGYGLINSPSFLFFKLGYPLLCMLS
jgi:hypothetical protein